MKAINIELIATVKDCPILKSVTPFYRHLPAIVIANVNIIQSQ